MQGPRRASGPPTRQRISLISLLALAVCGLLAASLPLASLAGTDPFHAAVGEAIDTMKAISQNALTGAKATAVAKGASGKVLAESRRASAMEGAQALLKSSEAQAVVSHNFATATSLSAISKGLGNLARLGIYAHLIEYSISSVGSTMVNMKEQQARIEEAKVKAEAVEAFKSVVQSIAKSTAAAWLAMHFAEMVQAERAKSRSEDLQHQTMQRTVPHAAGAAGLIKAAVAATGVLVRTRIELYLGLVRAMLNSWLRTITEHRL